MYAQCKFLFFLVEFENDGKPLKAINYDIGGMDQQPQIVINQSLVPQVPHIAMFTKPIAPANGIV